MTPILRTTAVPMVRSALHTASRHATQLPLLARATGPSTSSMCFSSTSYLATSEPPGKAPQQSPRKHQDQVAKARKNSTALLAASLGIGGLLAALLYTNQLSAEGQKAPQKRLSYSERVKAGLNKAAEGTPLESTVASITGEATSEDDDPVDYAERIKAGLNKAAEGTPLESSVASITGEATSGHDDSSPFHSNASSSSSSSSSSSQSGVDTIATAIEKDAGEGQEAAYDPSTGQINWDCPCLGGMASGPCGEEFKEAFSCFVFSEEEPKGVECVGKFKNMQDCFRRHPEEYKEELEMEEEDESQSLIYEVEEALGLGEQPAESRSVAA